MEEKEMGRKRTPEEEATQLICVTMNKLWTHQNVPLSLLISLNARLWFTQILG